jgi:hypothetical protein
MAKRDLEPFEEWLGKYQRIDAALLSSEELTLWLSLSETKS